MLSYIPPNFDIDNYLTEYKLGKYLQKIFQKDFIHDKKVPKSSLNTRPDYRNDELMLIVEFDGEKHYTDPNVIYRDKQKDDEYKKLGYKVIRIPYFIQLETRTIKLLFNVDFELTQEFPHGFIVDRNLVLPASYCKAGAQRFLKDKEFFACVWKEVEYSLELKMQKMPKELVMVDWWIL